MAKEKKASKTVAQSFEMRVMRRSDLTAAPYNPREIDDSARAKLFANLKRVGLIEPPVVNLRTGYIVSGHQRLELLDAIEGNSDYFLDVSTIDVDEVREKELNIVLNNPLAQGSFDIPKLASVLGMANFAHCGFDVGEVQAMVPNWEPPPSAVSGAAEGCDVMLVFANRDETDKFMELIKLSTAEKYIAGELIVRLLDGEKED